MSSHLQRQGLSAENVEMKMLDGLTRVTAAVGDHTVAVCQALRGGDFGDDCENVGHYSTVFIRDAIAVRDMYLGYHENMGGRLGGNVPESKDGVVSSYTFLEGMSPPMILQKRQSFIIFPPKL